MHCIHQYAANKNVFRCCVKVMMMSTTTIEDTTTVQLASCLIYAQALLEYVIFILWLRSFSKMLPYLKFAEDKVLV